MVRSFFLGNYFIEFLSQSKIADSIATLSNHIPVTKLLLHHHTVFIAAIPLPFSIHRTFYVYAINVHSKMLSSRYENRRLIYS